METHLIIRPAEKLVRFTLNDTAKELKSLALDGAAMIGKVANAEDNEKAVSAQREIKRVMNLMEKDRKSAKEPLIEAGRQLDSMVAGEVKELDEEFGRISQLIAEFACQEQERVREEQRAQQRELDRIEAQRQSELKRIADEAAAKEAEAAKIQDQAKREAELKRIAEEGSKAVAAATEQAADKTYVAAKPVFATRAEGQRVTVDWDIQVVNPWDLAKFHPDCCEVKPKLLEIKRYLNEGREVKGVVAKKVTKASVTVGRERTPIEV